jgi:hypothetical protein
MASVLMQTTVDKEVDQVFRDMAKMKGHKKASYLRHIIEQHVGAHLASRKSVPKHGWLRYLRDQHLEEETSSLLISPGRSK